VLEEFEPEFAPLEFPLALLLYVLPVPEEPDVPPLDPAVLLPAFAPE